MNEKRSQLIKLCSEKPKTTRQLVQATGESVGATRSRLYDLIKIGALKRTSLDDQYGTHIYEAVPGWRPKGSPDLTTYKPLGICVFGVWM